LNQTVKFEKTETTTLQKVDLYKHLDQRAEISEEFLQFVAASAVTVVVIICVAFWLLVQNAWLNRELASAKSQSDLVNQSIAKNTQHSADSLTHKIEQLQQQFIQRQAILALLERTKTEQQQIFSSQLAGLGKQRVEGLWLNHIELRRAGAEVALQGITREPALLPRYLRALGKEKAFAGLRFDLMRMQAIEESEEIKFEISVNPTNAEEENKS